MPRFPILLFVALLLPGLAMAQVFPTPNASGVTDTANMIPADAEARIIDRLATLETEKGVEIGVVTLSSVKFYANDMTIPDYATALFNDWGIGDPEKGDGILFIIFRDDHELRIELGKGYAAADQNELTNIVGGTIMPAFMDNNFAGGIESGIDEMITRIAAPVVSDVVGATNTDTGSKSGLYWFLGVIGGVAGLIFGGAKWRAAKLAKTPCPACSKTGTLSETSVTLIESTLDRDGKGETRTSCSACGHVTAKPSTLPRKTPDAKAAPFKGGQSKGDGASGKW